MASTFLQILKLQALTISMVCGVVGYFVFVSLGLSPEVHVVTNRVLAVVQPLMLFAMLFLSFIRISPSELRLCRWHLTLLLIQSLSFIGLSLIVIRHPDSSARVVLESAMLCLICPTATAAPVIVQKLGGVPAHMVTYTVLINLVVAVVVPLFAPLVYPQEGLTFLQAFGTIISKVFPLLIFPLVLAWLIRYALPRLSEKLQHTGDLTFYIWAVSLSLAIAVSTRSIVHSTCGVGMLLAIALVSLVCCVLQFVIGKIIGGRSGHAEHVTGGQSMGQKNTVLLIWMSYTFFTPVTAIAGGFYCIWHNLINTWQLNRVSQGGSV